MADKVDNMLEQESQRSPAESREEAQQLTEEILRLKEALAGADGWAKRRRLPTTRQGVTHKFEVDGHEGYITIGLHQDGTPGEMFVRMAKEGSTLGGLLDAVSILTSLSLQFGVPLELLCDKLSRCRYEPSGMTRCREIPVASSVTDYIFRWLESQFVEADESPGDKKA